MPLPEDAMSSLLGCWKGRGGGEVGEAGTAQKGWVNGR
jgi:hypothetical protein